MTAQIIRLPRTPYGRVELVCAKAKGLDLAGKDWDLEGAVAYARWKLARNGGNRRNSINGIIISSPDNIA